MEKQMNNKKDIELTESEIKIVRILIELIKEREETGIDNITYTEIAKRYGNNMQPYFMGRQLGHISLFGYKKFGLPLITANVVKNNGEIGKGFYEVLEETVIEDAKNLKSKDKKLKDFIKELDEQEERLKEKNK